MCCRGGSGKIVGALRIVLGVAMLAFGLMKLGVVGNVEAMSSIGGAAHLFGLTFLSVETWFWIAMTGEILAGLWLLLGHAVKGAAILTLIIMLFALKLTAWMEPKARAVVVLALVQLLWGPGCRTVCKCPACRACAKDDDACCATTGKSCCGGVCKESDTMKQGVDTMKAGAATMAAGAVATASGVVEKAKETVQTVKDVAETVIEKADTLVEQAKEMTEQAKDLVEQTGSDVAKKVVETAEVALEKASEVIDTAKETVANAADKIDDEQKDA